MSVGVVVTLSACANDERRKWGEEANNKYGGEGDMEGKIMK